MSRKASEERGAPEGRAVRAAVAAAANRVAAAASEVRAEAGDLLVAVSGGVDSSVLAHALVQSAPAKGSVLALGHVNHGLRGAESDADESFVRELGAALGIPVEVECVDLGSARDGASSRARPTLQEAARQARYRALGAIATRVGAARIATAHNADDQAETVLMRVLRGSGPRGLQGIPRQSGDGRVVRPLLRVTRAEILAYAQRHALDWREDPSNQSDRYTRGRIRHQWMPALSKEFNPKLSRALGNLAEAVGRDERWLESLVDEEASRRFVRSSEGLEIDCAGFAELPEALRWRLARRAIVTVGAGRELTEQHLRRVLDALGDARTPREIQLPQGLRLSTTGGVGRLRGLPGAVQGTPERPC